MNIFFLLRHTGYLRLFEPVVRVLAGKGHRVRLCFLAENPLYGEPRIREAFASLPSVSYEICGEEESRPGLLRKALRRSQDYLRYRFICYDAAPKLRKRASSRLPGFLRGFLDLWAGKDEKRIWACIGFLRFFENFIPVPERISRRLKEFAPERFLITPLLDFGAAQLDWLKAAKKAGIPSALCTASWDNLTNKGLIQIRPERVFVWNEAQKEEAVKLHRIPADSIRMTGAPVFDRWFEARPSLSGEAFRKKAGLPEGPYVLYVCSSRFIAPQETAFIEKWIETIRNHPDASVRSLGILVRPHPQNADAVDRQRLAAKGAAVFPWPPKAPSDEQSMADYYDSLYYSSAAAGINTSSMIEAGIVDKPVFTVLDGEFAETQGGTLHFRHLEEGGLLYASRSLEEHAVQMQKVLGEEDLDREKRRRFITQFVRPAGREKRSAVIMAEEIETWA